VETITRIWCDFSSRAARIKEIVRDLKVSRNTVRKVLGSGKTLSALRCPGDPEGEKRNWRQPPMGSRPSRITAVVLTVC
jgi:orotate phosphoribosyltransferase-like protein